uniref:Phospholipid/glycerol acyltransferase domain-containing protein n=1 Tax=Ditylenchus dipsaci TaxID=166011 RepID=A0A915DMI6_9BILA
MVCSLYYCCSLPRAWRWCADRLVGYWIVFPASMIFFLFDVKVHVTGDIIEKKKPALIIMNHRTRLDWLFFWNALYKMDPWLLTTEKISLKKGLKKIPGAGWAMGCGAYTFLSRNYEQDQRVLQLMLKYYKDSQSNYQLLLFPEGTDRGERAVQISHAFADKNKLQRYDYLLHPRTTGFNYILNQMRNNDYIEYVYDVTIGYPDKIVSSEMELLREGRFPASIHFDVKKYSISEILAASSALSSIKNKDEISSTIDCSNWLNTLWRAKEEKLRQFYASKDVLNRKFKPSGDGYQWPVANSNLAYYLAFLFWTLSSCMWIYFIYCSAAIKIYVALCVGFYVWADMHYGGIDFGALECSMDENCSCRLLKPA